MTSQINESKKKFPVVVCLAIGVVIIVVAVVVLAIFGNPTVTLDLQLDSKPLPLGVIPVVTMNGKPFHSGERVGVGHNSLSIVLNNAEPIVRSLWTFFGTDNLGTISLNTFKGSLSLTTTPSAVTFALRQGPDTIRSGLAPAVLNDVPAGDYDILISCGSYKESHAVKIAKGETVALDLKLKLADLALESSPADADYILTGNGAKWQGKLPTVISNVTFGKYTCTASRQGWDIVSAITVDKSGQITNAIEFPYAKINVTSDPSGLPVSSEGVELGKTPVTLFMKPGTCTLTAYDGENNLTTSISVGPKEAAKHDFAFLYGAVQLSSQPTGATVTRKGKEIGKTPLTLDHVLVGESSALFSLDGYGSTNVTVIASENVTAHFQVKLVSERYLQAMKKANDAFSTGQFSDSQTAIAAALEIEPLDPAAIKLRDEVSAAAAKAEEASRKEQANAKARLLAALSWLDFNQVISDCTDTKQVQYPVEMVDTHYETYRDNNGKYKQREVKGTPYTVMQTRTDSSFNPARFSHLYAGRTMGFNCPGQWAVSKVEQDGSVTFKGTALFDKIVATPPSNNPNAFQSLQKGQKVTMKVVTSKIERGFLNTTLYLENAEILTQ